MADRSKPSRRRPAVAGKPSTTPAARVARRDAFKGSLLSLSDVVRAVSDAVVLDAIDHFATSELRALFVKNGPYASAWSRGDLHRRAELMQMADHPGSLLVWLIWDGKPVFAGDVASLLADDRPFPVGVDDLRMIGRAMLAHDDRLRASVPRWLAPLALAVAGRKRGRPALRAVA